MIRKLIKLAIVLLVANALYQFVPVYYRYNLFKDAVREVALFGHGATDEAVADRVMELAEQYEIPLAREDLRVHHTETRVEVDATYIEIIEFVPTFEYEWLFDVDVR